MDFNPLSYAPDGTAIFARDDQLLVKFFRQPVLSQFKSKQQGVPVYDDTDMVSVIQPGEKEEIKVVADEFHQRRFPRQWEAFKKGIEQQMSGTPLDHLFPAEPGAVLNLKQYNVFTIQQLAMLSDTAMNNIPMGRTFSDRAKAYLHTAHPGEQQQQIAQMQAQISELMARLAERGEAPADAAPAAPQKRGPGRPPKEQAAA